MFDGQDAFSVEPGDKRVSDEIPIEFARGDVMTLMIAIGKVSSMSETSLEQRHSAPGNYTHGDFTALEYRNPLPGAPFNERLCGLKEILVKTEVGACIVAFGDSVTESAVWVNPLAEKIAQISPDTALVNMGIVGNRLLRDTNVPAMMGIQAFGKAGLRRLDSDVLSLSGAKAAILAMGINDIAQPGGAPGFSPPAEELCSFGELKGGLESAALRCRQLGLAVIGATITPFKGYPSYRPESAVVRRQINEWILSSGIFDAVLDFGKLLCDENDAELLKPAYGIGDGLHPNPLGGAAAVEKLNLNDILQKI